MTCNFSKFIEISDLNIVYINVSYFYQMFLLFVSAFAERQIWSHRLPWNCVFALASMGTVDVYKNSGLRRFRSIHGVVDWYDTLI